MNKYFNKINEQEYKILTETPLYVSLLIAYADEDLEDKEIDWAKKVSFFRIKTEHHSLREFYEVAHTFIDQNIDEEIANLPTNHKEKMDYLSDKIARINSILPKLKGTMGERIVASFKSFGLSIAEVNGGVFNFFALNADEEMWLNLPMIDFQD